MPPSLLFGRRQTAALTALYLCSAYLQRPCPTAWCNCGGVITALSGWAGLGQTATAGRPARGPSLKGATESRLI